MSTRIKARMGLFITSKKKELVFPFIEFLKKKMCVLVLVCWPFGVLVCGFSQFWSCCELFLMHLRNGKEIKKANQQQTTSEELCELFLYQFCLYCFEIHRNSIIKFLLKNGD